MRYEIRALTGSDSLGALTLDAAGEARARTGAGAIVNSTPNRTDRVSRSAIE